MTIKQMIYVMRNLITVLYDINVFRSCDLNKIDSSAYDMSIDFFFYLRKKSIFPDC